RRARGPPWDLLVSGQLLRRRDRGGGLPRAHPGGDPEGRRRLLRREDGRSGGDPVGTARLQVERLGALRLAAAQGAARPAALKGPAGSGGRSGSGRAVPRIEWIHDRLPTSEKSWQGGLFRRPGRRPASGGWGLLAAGAIPGVGG